MAIKRDKNFVKDLKRTPLCDKEFEWLCDFLSLLNARKPLPATANDHALKAEWQAFREFHIGGDKVVIYYFDDDENLNLVRIGTHAQVFKM